MCFSIHGFPRTDGRYSLIRYPVSCCRTTLYSHICMLYSIYICDSLHPFTSCQRLLHWSSLLLAGSTLSDVFSARYGLRTGRSHTTHAYESAMILRLSKLRRAWVQPWEAVCRSLSNRKRRYLVKWCRRRIMWSSYTYILLTGPVLQCRRG